MRPFTLILFFVVIASVALGSLIVVSGTIQDQSENIEEIVMEDEIKRQIYITIEDSVGSSDNLR